MRRETPVICITGGPCAGKSTALSYLRQKLSELGYLVVTVPEVATDLITSGIAPRPGTLEQVEFQRLVLMHTLEREERWLAAVDAMSAPKKVVLCDRGLMDGAAYCSPEDFERLRRDYSMSVVGMRDRRYDGVIHLQSVAVDAPHIYTCENNAARRESADEARALDARTLAAWTGHPHLRVLDNSTGLEGKLRRAFQAICRVLGIPAPIEIERKYLVTRFDARVDILSLPLPRQEVLIVQHYLAGDSADSEERVRMRTQDGDATYYHTRKEHIGPGVRYEYEHQISADEYAELLRKADRQYAPVAKRRICFVYEGQYFELDMYVERDLKVLEVELTDVQSSVLLPPCFASIASEVTGDPDFSNRYIARQIAASRQTR